MDQNRNEVSIEISNHSSLNKVNHQASNPDDIKVVEENEIEMEVYDLEEYESGGNDFKTLRISDSKDSTIAMDNISTSSEKEEELTRDEPEKWVPVKKPKSNEKSQKGPKIIHERSVSWEDVDLSEKENDVPDNRKKMKKYFKIIGAALLVLGVVIGVILSMVSFFGSANKTIFGETISKKVKLSEVDLFITRGISCGGENLYIEITIDEEKKCETEREESFNPYRTIKWGKEKLGLGSCKNIEFDANLEQIEFSIETDNAEDDFCPGKLTFKMKNGVTFIKDNMTEWEDSHPGVATKVVE